MTGPKERLARRARTPLAIAAGALLLRGIAGVGFANYDTLYALAWGGQLWRGQTPTYDVAVAPTPHPLLEALGLVLAPLGPAAAREITVALAFLALSACGWVLYRLGSIWFGRAAGALAALLFLTRVPVLSWSVRAYVDVPYVLLVLGALLLESRSRARGGRPAGGPALALLALAGLLRPEAWAFSALYWLYVVGVPARLMRDGAHHPPARSRGELLRLTLLAAAAPLLWLLGDLLVTGDPLWSLSNTRHTASELGRVRGIANVPEYIPRRIGEILRPPVLLGAALGGTLSLLWLRGRALVGGAAGLLAVVVFAGFAAIGLPINTRYALLASAILCVFCGAGAFGWLQLPREHPRRRAWIAAAVVVLLALLAYVPSQYRAADGEVDKIARQQSIEADLVALVHDGSINLRCGPVGVPNHAPVPLLALYLKTSPANVVSPESGQIRRGEYVEAANAGVERGYVLDPRDPHLPARVPSGFTRAGGNRSWSIFRRCR